MTTTALPASFWAKTTTSDCTVWIGAQNSKGYGCFAIDGVSQLAHRLVWEAQNGPIPDGQTIDHLCRVRNCVNVEHMEVVTRGENTRRAHSLDIGSLCGRGHEIGSSRDLYVSPRGRRECRLCRQDQARRATAKKAAA